MVYLGINNVVTKYAEATRIKTLTKHGNSAALVIERPILDLLGAAADTAFEVVTDGKALILTPVKDATRPDPTYPFPSIDGKSRQALCKIL